MQLAVGLVYQDPASDLSAASLVVTVLLVAARIVRAVVVAVLLV